jgi:sialate O-acetylesterase
MAQSRSLLTSSLLLLLLPALALAAPARLSNVFSRGAVLQSSPIPSGASATVLFGFADEGVSVTLLPTAPITSANITSSPAGADGVWRIPLPPAAPSLTPITLTFAASDDSPPFSLPDVLVGHVLLCSGQSNMGLPLSSLWNASDVVAAATAPGLYGSLRLFQAPGSTSSPTHLLEFTAEGLSPWQPPLVNNSLANNRTLLGFSASCYIMGATLADSLNHSVAIGLIESARGGTSILTWQSAASVYTCGDLPSDGWNASELYNSNINPLTVGPLALAGAVYYQGEEDCGLGPSNTFWRSAWYSCSLQSLISDWRGQLQQPSLPVVIQQLHAWIHDVNTTGESPGDFGLALLRRVQAKAVDTVPFTALSVAFDGGDPTDVSGGPTDPAYSPGGTVHPRCKYIPGRRQALAMQRLLEQAAAATAREEEGEVVVADGEEGIRGRPAAPGPLLLYPAYSHAVARSLTVANGTATDISVTVFFAPGTTGSGLALLPFDPASNSSHCPTERGVNSTYCDWFAVQLNDKYPGGTWINASVAVGADGASLVLSVVAPAPGLCPVATRAMWSDWPVVTAYTNEGLPVLPWLEDVAN